MTQPFQPALPSIPARPPRRSGTLRVILALMLREMSTTYGKSALGYLWAVLEPAAGIMLMTVIFSAAFRSPAIGTNFPLFFASGILPFMMYGDIGGKLSVALRFSKQLLNYPGVTYLDALIARCLLSTMTHIMISSLVLAAILVFYDVDVILDVPAIALALLMAVSLGVGIGTLNCFLLSIYPIWERTWAILNRPLFIISCIFFLYDNVPEPYRGWLWWNPIIHIVGQMRSGIYATYDASYVSLLYVFLISGVTLTLGLLLLRRYHRDIINI